VGNRLRIDPFWRYCAPVNAHEPKPSAPERVPDKLLAMGLAGLGLAHELNSPLTATALGLELLAVRLRSTTPPDPEVAADAVDRLLGTVRRMGTLVDRFRRFARGDGGRPTSFPLDDAVDEVQVLIRPALSEVTDVRLRRGAATPDASVFIDRILHEQAIAIAVLNSADALGEGGGVITVSTGHVDAGFAAIFVDDDGPGFPSPTDSAELGYSTKGGNGMGVGLALATGIIEGAGGRLTTVNRDGGGARVRMILPLRASTPSI